MRGEIIPVINLHKRFNLHQPVEQEETEALERGFIILSIEDDKIGIIIDKIARVVVIDKTEIQPPPQMLSGIGTEYIHGVTRVDTMYLIILDTRKIFNPKELQKIIDIN